MAAARQHQQHPAEHQPDRQAADVAEEQSRDRPVERRKADHAAEQRQRDEDRGRRRGADQAEQRDAGGNRHDFGDGHPVDAVHEVDEIDEPDAADEQDGEFERARKLRHDAEIHRQRREHGANRQRLQHEPRRGAEPADVVDRPDQRKREDRSVSAASWAPAARPDNATPIHRPQECGRHDGDAAALRGRLAVRGARVRARQCVAHEQGPQHDDQPGARRDRRNQHQAEHRHRWPAVPHRTSNSHRPLFKLKRIPKETGCGLESCLGGLFRSDLPSPAEASVDTMGLCKGFAQAGNRYPLFRDMRYSVASRRSAECRCANFFIWSPRTGLSFLISCRWSGPPSRPGSKSWWRRACASTGPASRPRAAASWRWRTSARASAAPRCFAASPASGGSCAMRSRTSCIAFRCAWSCSAASRRGCRA